MVVGKGPGMKTTRKPFQEALREVLAEQDVSMRELTKRTQANDNWGNIATVSMYARGEQVPTLEAMEKIAKALHISPKFFPEYRLAVARRNLDPRAVGLAKALRNLGE